MVSKVPYNLNDKDSDPEADFGVGKDLLPQQTKEKNLSDSEPTFEADQQLGDKKEVTETESDNEESS